MSSAAINQYNDYISRKENSELLLRLVDKYVKVDIIKNCSYRGFVHSIDPVTDSMILFVPLEDTFQTIMIPGHAILNVTEEEASTNLKPPVRKPTLSNSKEDILKRKNKLMTWFKFNLLPVSELEDKIVIGSVSLLPPYDISDLCTENPIVAQQIKKIMERMPEDFEP